MNLSIQAANAWPQSGGQHLEVGASLNRGPTNCRLVAGTILSFTGIGNRQRRISSKVYRNSVLQAQHLRFQKGLFCASRRACFCRRVEFFGGSF